MLKQTSLALLQTSLALLLSVTTSLTVYAQRPGGLGSARLDRSGMKIGMELPDVAVYDAKGEKFELRRLRGRHTVLVFGCLT